MNQHLPIRLFYSYSHIDEALRNELNNHLKILQREGFIDEWHDRRITAGNEWRNDIDQNLGISEIILLLISADFIASDYCYDKEMQTALKMHDEGRSVVIPVILRECAWQIAPFSRLQAIPTDGKAITGKDWHDKDQAFTVVAKQLKIKVEELWKGKDNTAIEDTSITPIDKLGRKVQNKLKQIPVVKPYFSGRQNEIEELEKAFLVSAVIVIEGSGGIGKTQLAAKFIDKMNFHDRVIWYNCYPTSQPDDIIIGSGFEELLKGENKTQLEKFSAFKEKLEEHNFILFLDNYQEVEKKSTFQTFLNFVYQYLGNKGHVIILGRNKIDSPTFLPKIIHLKGLGDNSTDTNRFEDSIVHARKLLDYSYPHKRDISDETLRSICATLLGYPLAIDLAVHLLSRNVSAEKIIEVTVEREKDSDGNKESISERLLNEIFSRPDATEEERLFLKLFSIYNGKIHENAIRAIIPVDIFNAASSSLFDRNLLAIDGSYYEIHPLVREFSYDRLENRESVHLKAAQYYKAQRNNTLDANLEEEIFYHLSRAKEWVEICDNVLLTGREFVSQGYHDRLLQVINALRDNNVTNEIFQILEGDIAQIRGDYQNALLIFKKSDQITDQDIKIECQIKYGEMLFRIGEVKEAKKIYDPIIQMTNTPSLIIWHARVMNNLALVDNFFGNYDIALDQFESALLLREQIGDRHAVADTLMNIASLYAAKDDHKEALKRFNASHKLNVELNIKWNIANTLRAIAGCKAELSVKNIFNESIALLHESQMVSKEIGDIEGISFTFYELAHINQRLGKIDDAIVLINKALKIAREIGNKINIATNLNALAVFRDLQDGDNSEILKLYEEAASLGEQSGNKKNTSLFLSNIGHFLVDKSLDLDKACFVLVKSFAITNEIGLEKREVSAFNSLISLKNKIGVSAFKDLLKLSIDKLDNNLKKMVDIDKILGEPRKAEVKIGRNESCPCGSGKKYKNCHWKS